MLHFIAHEHFYEFVFLAAGIGIGVMLTLVTIFVHQVLTGTWGVVKAVTNVTQNAVAPREVKFGESYRPDRNLIIENKGRVEPKLN